MYIIGVITGDTRSLDYSSYGALNGYQDYGPSFLVSLSHRMPQVDLKMILAVM